MRFQAVSLFPKSFALVALAALAFAACSTAPKPVVEVRDDPSRTPAAPKTVAEEAAAVVKDLRNYSVHSFDDDVHAKIPPALAFLADHAGDVSNKTQLAEVKVNVIRTSVRAKDFDIALPVARELLAGDDPRLGWKIEAAD